MLQGAGGITLMGYYPSCTADMYPELLVWLGAGDGWSLPVQLRSDIIKPEVCRFENLCKLSSMR